MFLLKKVAEFLRKNELKEPITEVPRSTVEALVIVGRFLAQSCAFGTLASVNRTCRKVHEVTLATLYETLILKYSASLSSIAKHHCVGFRYVKNIIIENAPPFFDLDAFILDPPDSSKLFSIRNTVLDQASHALSGKHDRPYEPEFGPETSIPPQSHTSSSARTAGPPLNIPALFPGMSVGIVKRQEPTRRGNVPVLPCDLFLYRQTTFEKLRWALAPIIPVDIHGDRTTPMEVHAFHLSIGIREFVLHIGSALVTTEAERERNAVLYARHAIPGAMWIRLTALPEEPGNVDWLQELAMTLDWFRAARGNVAVARTTIKCSFRHLEGIMSIAGHQLPSQCLVAELMDRHIDPGHFHEVWHEGCKSYTASLRRRIENSAIATRFARARGHSSVGGINPATNREPVLVLVARETSHHFGVRIVKRDFPHHDYFEEKLTMKKPSTEILYIALKPRYMDDFQDPVTLDWTATLAKRQSAPKDVPISEYPQTYQEILPV